MTPPDYDDCDEDLSLSLQYSDDTSHHISHPSYLGLGWCLEHLVMVLVRLQLHLVTSHSVSSSSVCMVVGSLNWVLVVMRQIHTFMHSKCPKSHYWSEDMKKQDC